MTRRKTQPPVQRGETCSKCGNDEWRWYDKWTCSPCQRDRWRARHSERDIRHRNLRQRYGLTPESFDDLLRAQGGRCAICDEPMGGRRGPMVDHCHDSDRVRGLLCQQCNTLLGAARDDPARLTAARDYLNRHHPERTTA